MTELERVQNATKEEKTFVAKRLKEVSQWEYSGFEEDEGVCFFCDRPVFSVNHPEILSGDGWRFYVLTDKGHVCAMYHGKNEACRSSLMWRESQDGGSYSEVIGEYGLLGLTPSTTLYNEEEGK